MKKINRETKKKVIKTALKVVIGGAASIGAGFVIEKYGMASLMGETNRVKKILMAIGVTALGAAAGTAAGAAVNEQIDVMVDAADATGQFFDIMYDKISNSDKEETV